MEYRVWSVMCYKGMRNIDAVSWILHLAWGPPAFNLACRRCYSSRHVLVHPLFAGRLSYCVMTFPGARLHAIQC